MGECAGGREAECGGGDGGGGGGGVVVHRMSSIYV